MGKGRGFSLVIHLFKAKRSNRNDEKEEEAEEEERRLKCKHILPPSNCWKRFLADDAHGGKRRFKKIFPYFFLFSALNVPHYWWMAETFPSPRSLCRFVHCLCVCMCHDGGKYFWSCHLHLLPAYNGFLVVFWFIHL